APWAAACWCCSSPTATPGPRSCATSSGRRSGTRRGCGCWTSTPRARRRSRGSRGAPWSRARARAVPPTSSTPPIPRPRRRRRRGRVEAVRGGDAPPRERRGRRRRDATMSLYQGRALQKGEPRRRGGRVRRVVELLVAFLAIVALVHVPWEGLRRRFAVVRDI